MAWKLSEAASPPGSISLGLSSANIVRSVAEPMHDRTYYTGDVEAGVYCYQVCSLRAHRMALGRVLVYCFLLLGLHNAEAMSLDLEGLKDQALSHITGPKLMDIVSVAPCSACTEFTWQPLTTSYPCTCET